MDKALQMISQHAEDGAKLRRDFFAVHGGKVAEAARRMAVAVARGGNDFGYDLVFTKQVQALGRPGDVFVGISTSGNSANVIGALQASRKQSLFTIGLTGDGGGRMAPLCDILLAVGHPSTPLVQETHAAIGHMLCALTDYYLFENVMAIKPMLD